MSKINPESLYIALSISMVAAEPDGHVETYEEEGRAVVRVYDQHGYWDEVALEGRTIIITRTWGQPPHYDRWKLEDGDWVYRGTEEEPRYMPSWAAKTLRALEVFNEG